MTNYDESVSGDLSGNPSAPTAITLTAGDNMVTATQGIPDDDFLRVTIPSGFRLEQIIVVNYSDADLAFIAVDDGATFSENPANPDPASLLGGTHYGPAHVGTDILDNIGASAGLGFPGFTPPLTGSTYTFWFNQTADDSTVTFNFVLVAFGPTSGPDMLSGGAGPDTIDGLAGNDTIVGGDGADSLIGNGDNDSLDGGAANDTVIGGLGRDILLGGAGDDVLNGGAKKDTMNGGAGADTLAGGGKGDQMTGGDENDVLFGVTGNDILDGGLGDDILRGAGGRDNIGGDDGADAVEAGPGDDSVSGGSGDDTILGGSGDDTLLGFDDDDSINGAVGNDSIVGGNGDDTFLFVIGGGVDTIVDFAAGAAGPDVVRLLGFGPSFDTFGEVIGAATDDGTNTTIDFGGGNMLILRAVVVADLHANDFIFG